MLRLALAGHGWFHLLDYPLFISVGMVLVLTTWRRREPDRLALDILRMGASITLLWSGIEKFAYPQWSFPMMEHMPSLSFGVSPETAMYMYGFGEVALALGMLVFGFGDQVAAGFLPLVFLAAIPPFGWTSCLSRHGSTPYTAFT